MHEYPYQTRGKVKNTLLHIKNKKPSLNLFPLPHILHHNIFEVYSICLNWTVFRFVSCKCSASSPFECPIKKIPLNLAWVCLKEKDFLWLHFASPLNEEPLQRAHTHALKWYASKLGDPMRTSPKRISTGHERGPGLPETCKISRVSCRANLYLDCPPKLHPGIDYGSNVCVSPKQKVKVPCKTRGNLRTNPFFRMLNVSPILNRFLGISNPQILLLE